MKKFYAYLAWKKPVYMQSFKSRTEFLEKMKTNMDTLRKKLFLFHTLGDHFLQAVLHVRTETERSWL